MRLGIHTLPLQTRTCVGFLWAAKAQEGRRTPVLLSCVTLAQRARLYPPHQSNAPRAATTHHTQLPIMKWARQEMRFPQRLHGDMHRSRRTANDGGGKRNHKLTANASTSDPLPVEHFPLKTKNCISGITLGKRSE